MSSGSGGARRASSTVRCSDLLLSLSPFLLSQSSLELRLALLLALALALTLADSLSPLADTIRDQRTNARLLSYSRSGTSLPANGYLKTGIYRAIIEGATSATAYVGDFAFGRE